MIEIRVERSKHGIYTANFMGGWAMQIDKQKAIDHAKKILRKEGYTDDDFVIVEGKDNE